jgi:hypothetical protein
LSTTFAIGIRVALAGERGARIDGERARRSTPCRAHLDAGCGIDGDGRGCRAQEQRGGLHAATARGIERRRPARRGAAERQRAGDRHRAAAGQQTAGIDGGGGGAQRVAAEDFQQPAGAGGPKHQRAEGVGAGQQRVARKHRQRRRTKAGNGLDGRAGRARHGDAILRARRGERRVDMVGHVVPVGRQRPCATG